MSFLPVNSQLGQIKVVEIFDFYDIPRLFIGTNQIGQLFIIYNLDDDRVKTEWYYLPVSEERICNLKTGSMDLRTALLSPELGFLYSISIGYIDGDSQIAVVTSESINQEWLPEAGETLYSENSNSSLVAPALSAKATRLNRECLDLRMMFPRSDAFCAPMRQLGNLWVSLQQLVDNLCAVADGIVPNKYGKLPIQLTMQSELLVEASYVGSYGSHIIATNQAAMVQDSPLTGGLTQLSTLLDDGLGSKDIRSVLEPLGVRCATRYRVLLEQLAAARVDVEIQRASPNGTHNSCSKMGKDMARFIADQVKAVETELSDQYKIPCIITAYSSTNNTFGMEYLEDGTRISGKVEKEAIPPEMHVTILDRYVASIREIVEVNATTGEEKRKHSLTKLEEWYDMEAGPN